MELAMEGRRGDVDSVHVVLLVASRTRRIVYACVNVGISHVFAAML